MLLAIKEGAMQRMFSTTIEKKVKRKFSSAIRGKEYNIINEILNGHIVKNIYLIDEVLEEKNGMNALHIACEVGEIAFVKTFLHLQANPNQQDKYGRTPMMIACLKNYIDIVKLLLDSEADYNITNFNGNGAIHIASLNGHTEIVKYLHSKGCNITRKNKDKATCLDLAKYNEHTDLIAYLTKEFDKIDLWKRRRGILLSYHSKKIFTYPLPMHLLKECAKYL